MLMWIALWSSLLGVVSGWQETALPVRVGAKDRRDHQQN
jgi:hypothetical protein